MTTSHPHTPLQPQGSQYEYFGQQQGGYWCYLGLGSNLVNELGTPITHIQSAAQRLELYCQISHIRLSSLYGSKPMGPQDQPDFINAVAEIYTSLEPLDLLEVCQQLEQAACRKRVRHWGERSLDVDILLYGNEQVNLPKLQIPHAGIQARNFVLVPLAELNPELVINGTPILDMALSKDWTGLSKLTTQG